jgi:hypothetical protein
MLQEFWTTFAGRLENSWILPSRGTLARTGCCVFSLACNGAAVARTTYGSGILPRIARFERELFHEMFLGFNGRYSSVRIDCRPGIRRNDYFHYGDPTTRIQGRRRF